MKLEIIPEIKGMFPATVQAMQPQDLFLPENMATIIDFVSSEARKLWPDTSTEKGRKAIKSNAYLVARSATFLDDLGKKVNDDKRAAIKATDEQRKKMRDSLEALKLEVRKPFEDWEEQEKARIAAEQLAEELDRSWDDAHAYHALFLREKEIAAREAEAEKKAAEQKAKDEAEAAEKARLAHEESIRKEAAEKAKREAAEAVRKCQNRRRKGEGRSTRSSSKGRA